MSLIALTHKRYYKCPQDPKIIEKVRQIRLHLQKVTDKRTGKVPVHQRNLVGYTLDEAIGHLKSFEQHAKNKKKSIVLSIQCKLASEQYASNINHSLFRSNGIRGTMKLPVSTNSTAILLVFTNTARQELAKNAGAHIVGGEELMTPMLEGKLEFNRCLATTDMLSTVMKLARYLGPKGLMPNSKNGTLTNDIVPAIKESLNSIPFRIEKFAGLTNIPVARLEFEPMQIKTNVVAAIEKILSLSTLKKKPSDFIKAMCLNMHGHPGILIKRSEYEQLQNLQLKSNHKIPIKPLFSLKPFKSGEDNVVVPDIVYG